MHLKQAQATERRWLRRRWKPAKDWAYDVSTDRWSNGVDWCWADPVPMNLRHYPSVNTKRLWQFRDGEWHDTWLDQ